MLGVPIWVIIVMAVAVLLGAAVQGLVGLGLGLMAAPVVTLVAPQLMPGVLLWLGMLLPLVHLLSQRRQVDWGGLAWALPARVPGTALGAWLVAVVSTQGLGIVVGVMVLLAVVLTWRAVDVAVTPTNLSVAGAISGATGTATSIGGPPMALLYQRRPPQQIRDTLAVYFVVGSAMSLIGLAVSGQMQWSQMWTALILAPMLVLGLTLGRGVGRRVSVETIRPALLVVCAVSAVVLIVRSLTG